MIYDLVLFINKLLFLLLLINTPLLFIIYYKLFIY